jgi:hypothetical protein
MWSIISIAPTCRNTCVWDMQRPLAKSASPRWQKSSVTSQWMPIMQVVKLVLKHDDGRAALCGTHNIAPLLRDIMHRTEGRVSCWKVFKRTFRYERVVSFFLHSPLDRTGRTVQACSAACGMSFASGRPGLMIDVTQARRQGMWLSQLYVALSTRH